MATPRSEGSSNRDIEVRVGRLEGEFEQMVQSVNQLTSSFGDFRTAIANDLQSTRRDLTVGVNQLSDRLADKTTPNMVNMATWAGVIVAMLGGILAPLLYAMNESAKRDRDDTMAHFSELDTKLQKEFALALEATNKSTAAVDDASKDRHVQAMKLIDSTDANLKDLIATGSPITRERLARLETEITHIVKQQEDFSLNGSPGLREAMAKMNDQLININKLQDEFINSGSPALRTKIAEIAATLAAVKEWQAAYMSGDLRELQDRRREKKP